MGDLSQIERLVQILKLFSRGAGQSYTTAQLAEKFEKPVHIRTIQRDLINLERAGISFKKRRIRGNEHSWSLDSTFRANFSIPIGINEYLSTFIMKDALKIFQGTQMEVAAKNLSDEIDSVLPDEIFDELTDIDVTDIFENIDTGVYNYSTFSDIIDDLIRAITKRQRCRVSYLKPFSSEPEDYSTEPRKIVHYNGALYIVVYQRDRTRFIQLAIHRIDDVQVLEEKFPDLPKYDSTQFYRGRFGVFGTDKIEQVELKFSKGIAYHIENRMWDDSQKISYDAGGNLILKMEIGITPELVSWILGWGKYCVISKPSEFRTNINAYY